MPEFDPKSIFSKSADLSKYVIEPLPVEPKPVDKRGYIYLVRCSGFLDYVKIGKTRDMVKRLAAYHQDRPVKSVSPIYISYQFKNANLIEKRILDFMYMKYGTAGNSSEWFDLKYKDMLIELIKEAEAYFK